MGAIEGSDPRIAWRFTCTACPVQAIGMIGKKDFYFRARYDKWSFAVGDNLEEAERAAILPQEMKAEFTKVKEYGEKGSYQAGWMELKEAEQIIIECCKAYLEAKADLL